MDTFPPVQFYIDIFLPEMSSLLSIHASSFYPSFYLYISIPLLSDFLSASLRLSPPFISLFVSIDLSDERLLHNTDRTIELHSLFPKLLEASEDPGRQPLHKHWSSH